MPTLKAIETVYKGYRFRSRLEARWAVFFDALNIRWEYEKEGYDLGSAGWYLPDFWLPDMPVWLEVKGQAPNDREVIAATALSEQATVLIVIGDPYEFESRLFEFGCEPIPNVMWKFGCKDHRRSHSPKILYQPRQDGPWRWCPDIKRAAEAARQARFEHGAPVNTVRRLLVKPSYPMSRYTPHRHRHLGDHDQCIDCGWPDPE